MKKLFNKTKQIVIILCFMATGAMIWSYHNQQIKNIANETKNIIKGETNNLLHAIANYISTD